MRPPPSTALRSGRLVKKNQAAGAEGLAGHHGDLLDHRSFQLFNEPSILQNMVPGNAITTYYTPNMYAYNLSFTGNQSNYAAALAIVMAIINHGHCVCRPA